MPRVTVIDYGIGNLLSVARALEQCGAAVELSDDPAVIAVADYLVLPGVGAFADGMLGLAERGLVDPIREFATRERPFLGICLGMQLMCRHSEEYDTDCLGLFDIAVEKFPEINEKGNPLKIPHMGWNKLEELKSPLFAGLPEDSFCYFVHSYYAELSEYTIATTHYGLPFSSALHRDNFYGVQFHPEKSAEVGEVILRNFLRL